MPSLLETIYLVKPDKHKLFTKNETIWYCQVWNNNLWQTFIKLYLIRICTVAKDLPELRPKNVGAIFWNTIRGYDLEAQSS